jgi:hypothetical protein
MEQFGIHFKIQSDESAVVQVTLVKVLGSITHEQYEEGISDFSEDIYSNTNES